MKFLSCRSLFSRCQKKNVKRSARLFLESLEDRLVPAGTFELQLEEAGFSPLLIPDNSALDQNPASGIIAYGGTYGDFTIDITTAKSNSAAPPANQTASLSLDVAELSITNNDPTAAHVLTISASDNGFNFPSGSPLVVNSSAGSTVATPNNPSTITWQGFADPGDVDFAETFATTPVTMLYPTNPTLTSQSGNTSNGGLTPAVPYYSLTGVLTANLSGGATLSDFGGDLYIFGPSITTNAGGTVVLGSNSPLTDSATLTGGRSPTGNITFNLYAPSDTTYSNPVYTTTVPISGEGTCSVNSIGSTNPGGYLPAVPGVYQWVATYSGDSNNSSITSGQGNEPELVTPAVLLSTIDGTKFLDTTGNGFSPDDVPEAGVTMNLYQESNSTNGLQTGAGGDVFVAATTTAANGTYSFKNLPPAVYYVQEVLPIGYIQTGGGPFGVAGNTYYAITAHGSKTYSGNNFDDYLIPTCTPTNISFTITNNYWPVIVGSLQGNTQQGDKVTVTFTVPQGGMTDQLTLVSYIAPGPTFSVYTAHEQQVFDEASGYFKPGNTYCLTILIPNNYYQIDLVCGPAIKILNPVHVGPDSSNISYQLQDRLLSYDNGGSQPFTDKPIVKGDFATAGFWTTATGNSVLLGLNNVKSFDDPTNLAQWLATSFPNLYGPDAGSHSMVNPDGTYFTDAQVAASYAANFAGGDQQVLSTALSVYATSINFAVNDDSWAGFNVSLAGSGMDTFNIGTEGAAFGVRNDTTLTVMQLLIDVNAHTIVGSPVSTGASSVFTEINVTGGV